MIALKIDKDSSMWILCVCWATLDGASEIEDSKTKIMLFYETRTEFINSIWMAQAVRMCVFYKP